jgi:aryl-alcohol dehydrogenase-like predicted oxidoreductase
VELGVYFLDTAEIYPVAYNYGKTTEEWIGNWLQKRVAAGTLKREDIYIATKCNPAGIGSPEDRVSHNFSAARLEASARASLTRLHTDYIDLFYLHFPSRFGFAGFGWGSYGAPERYAASATSDGSPADIERQVLAVKHLFELGLIKHWALSNENAYGLTMFCVTCDRLGVPRPICVQNDMSLNNRAYEGDLAEAAHQFGVVGLPYGALGGGVLTGKYHERSYQSDDGRPIEESRMRARPEFQPRYIAPVALAATTEYIALAAKYGIAPLELALAWARDRWYNGGVIIGTTSVAQVEACVNAFKLEPLPASLNDEIDAIHERYRNPSAAYVSKDLVLTAPWLQGSGVGELQKDEV